MKSLVLTTVLLSTIFWSSAQSWEQLTLPTTQNIISSSFVSDSEGWIGYENASSTATIYHTTDGGATWSAVSVGASGTSYVCFVSSSEGYVVVAGKAYKTVNGGSTWTQISLPGEPFYEPFFLNENTGFIAGKGEVYKTIDGGNQWIAYPVSYHVKLEDMHFLNDSIGFASNNSDLLWYTNDGGESWEFISDIHGCCYDYHAVYYNPDGYLTYAGSGENVFGEYASFIGGNASSIYGYSYISEVIGSLFDLKWYDSNRGYASGQNGIVVFTEDGGETWDEINLCELFNLSLNRLLALDGFETVYVFGAGGIGFKHDVECTAPTSLSANNITASSAKLTWNEVSSDDQYWLQYKAVGAPAWTKISTTNNYKKISSLAPETQYSWKVKSICSNNPLVNSDWTVKQFFTTKSLKSAGEISVTTLDVYPNPFAAATTIAFSLSNASNINIDLTDLSGRKIKTIADGNFEEGNHKLTLKKENLDAGVYVLRLETSTGVRTEKLIVE